MVVKNNRGANDPNYVEIQIATRLEVATLTTTHPNCAVGSVAIVEEDWSVWKFCIDLSWKEMV